MNKIFLYELKRLLGNKFFIGLFIITLLQSWIVLSGTIILGVANTAPFSPWSFGSYLSQVMPFICIAELFFITFYTGKNGQSIRILTDATKADPKKYHLIRCCAVLTGTILIIIGVFLVSAIFYSRLFGFISFLDFILPSIVVIIPPVFFFLGLGFAGGLIHVSLPYVLMAIAFFSSGLMGNNFFSGYPLTLNILDPSFSISTSFLLSRFVYLIIGIIAILWTNTSQTA